jgi:hypothetical protein
VRKLNQAVEDFGPKVAAQHAQTYIDTPAKVAELTKMAQELLSNFRTIEDDKKAELLSTRMRLAGVPCVAIPFEDQQGGDTEDDSDSSTSDGDAGGGAGGGSQAGSKSDE